MMKFKKIVPLAALLTIGLLSAPAYADSITFTLTNPNGDIYYSLGGSLAYAADISAPAGNSAPVFLNGDSFNVTAPVTLDDSDFFSKVPASLAPGASFTGDLFVLTLPPNSPVGTFVGTFTLLGGANNNASSTLGTVNFSLTSVTPEPSSAVLLMTGMAGLAMILLCAGFKGNLAAEHGSRAEQRSCAKMLPAVDSGSITRSSQ
jgi:hypothetical protein